MERATGRGVAVKAIRTETGGWLDRRDYRHLAFLLAEISVHREVSTHPFVVDLLGVFEDPEACFIVEELARGGSLLDHLHSRASMGTEGEVRVSYEFVFQKKIKSSLQSVFLLLQQYIAFLSGII